MSSSDCMWPAPSHCQTLQQILPPSGPTFVRSTVENRQSEGRQTGWRKQLKIGDFLLPVCCSPSARGIRPHVRLYAPVGSQPESGKQKASVVTADWLAFVPYHTPRVLFRCGVLHFLHCLQTATAGRTGPSTRSSPPLSRGRKRNIRGTQPPNKLRLGTATVVAGRPCAGTSQTGGAGAISVWNVRLANDRVGQGQEKVRGRGRIRQRTCFAPQVTLLTVTARWTVSRLYQNTADPMGLHNVELLLLLLVLRLLR